MTYTENSEHFELEGVEYVATRRTDFHDDGTAQVVCSVIPAALDSDERRNFKLIDSPHYRRNLFTVKFDSSGAADYWPDDTRFNTPYGAPA